MRENVSVIGVSPGELDWVRKLVALLRHPDPAVPELARQALLFLGECGARPEKKPVEPLNHAG